jgi:hypothetical protein
MTNQSIQKVETKKIQKCPSDSPNTVVFINKHELIPAILVKTSQFTCVRFAMAGGRVIKYAIFFEMVNATLWLFNIAMV